MKKLLSKRGLLLAAAALLASQIWAQEVSKEFRKEFSADAGTITELNNRYGNIIVTGWNNDKVEIYVKVSIEMPDKSRAERLLNMIDVQFGESDGRVSAKTVIDEDFNFSGWGTNRKFSINYTVKMPLNSGLEVVNRYGNVDIGELAGRVFIDVKYGNLTAAKLTRGNEKPLNRIEIGYGKMLVKSGNWLDLYLRYATLAELPSCQALLIDSKYSKLRIGTVNSAVITARYDNYSIDNINNLVIDKGYTTLSVNNAGKKISIEGSCGSVNIDHVSKDFEMIEVNTRYTGVRLGIDPAASYRLEGRSSYSGIRVPEELLTVRKRIVENTSTEIEGLIGKNKDATAYVKVESSYGSVKLY